MNVSQREAKAFRRLSIDLDTNFVMMHDPLMDVIEEHRAFLKALRNSILRNPSAYGPEAAAAEGRQEKEWTTFPASVQTQKIPGVAAHRSSGTDGIELERIPVSQLLLAMGRLTFGSWVLIIGAVVAILGIAYGLGVVHGKGMASPIAAPADNGFQRVPKSDAKPQAHSTDSARDRPNSAVR